MTDEAEQAKKLILDCYGIEQLRTAFVNRTQEPMFGQMGKIAAPKPADYYQPHELVWIGYEALTDSLYNFDI